MTPAVLAASLAVLLAASGCGGDSPLRPPAGPPAQANRFQNEGWKTDFSSSTVALDEFVSGGPPRDGIPPIDSPRFAAAEEIGFLQAGEPVIELVVADEARAYPIQILIWHEIVNDDIAGVPVAVTFCPLCNTALAFDRRVDGKTLDFGTTGKVRNSGLVMYDRQTESWWQQFGGKALVGAYAGRELEQLPARIVAWREFQREHPDGLVLLRPAGRAEPSPFDEVGSRTSGYLRPYGENPYPGYDDVDSPPFFAPNARDRRLSPKERVVFIERGSDSVAVPFSSLAKRRTMRLEVGGRVVEIRYLSGLRSPLDEEDVAAGREIGAVEVRDERGKLVEFDAPFWFAVAAFRPDVEIVR